MYFLIKLYNIFSQSQ